MKQGAHCIIHLSKGNLITFEHYIQHYIIGQYLAHKMPELMLLNADCSTKKCLKPRSFRGRCPLDHPPPPPFLDPNQDPKAKSASRGDHACRLRQHTFFPKFWQ